MPVSISSLTQTHFSSIPVPFKTFLRDNGVLDRCYCDALTISGRTEYMHSYPAPLIANYFIDAALKDGQPVSHMKLQKLLYFAHGIALASEGCPLLDETIEAWRYGPVVSSIYHQFKSYGSNPITELLPGHDIACLAEDSLVLEILNFVWSSLKNFTPYKLSEMTHLPGGPWEIAKKGNQGKLSNVLINNDLIKNYFIKRYRKDDSS